MSDLKELVGLGDSTTFPGRVLSSPRLIEFAEAEEEAAGQYVRRIVKAAAVLPAEARQGMHHRAVDNLRSQPFSYGTPGFDQWALSMSAAPFLAWLLLRIRQPRITLAETAELLHGDDWLAKMNAVWALWGYKPTKKAPTPPADSATLPGIVARSTGGESSEDSPSRHLEDSD